VGPNPTATLTLGLQHVAAVRRDWDLLELRWINRDEQDHQRTPWAMQHAGFRAQETTWRSTGVIDLDRSWHSYWRSRSSRLRDQLTRREQQLRRLGAVEHIRYRPEGAADPDGDPRWDLFEACVEIAARDGAGGAAARRSLGDDRIAEFFRDAHAAASRKGMLDVNLLCVDGRAVAFQYNYVYRDRLVALHGGQVAELAGLDVRDVLLRLMLRDSMQRGDRLLDLGHSPPGVLTKWSTRMVDSYRYAHFPRRIPRVQLLRFRQWALGPDRVALRTVHS
jgi:hypothetical protein